MIPFELVIWDAQDLRGNVAVLRDTKNGTSREVPLSEKAMQVLRDAMPEGGRTGSAVTVPGQALRIQCAEGIGREPKTHCTPDYRNPTLFSLTAGTISTRFRELCKEVGIKGLSFHCLRRTAATRLSKKLDVWELCAMFGWRDPKIPMKHYYKSDTAEIARRLD